MCCSCKTKEHQQHKETNHKYTHNKKIAQVWKSMKICAKGKKISCLKKRAEGKYAL